MNLASAVTRVFVALMMVAPAVSAQSGYQILKQFPIEASDAAKAIVFDEETQRLFLPRSREVEVLDANTGVEVGKVSDMPVVQSLVLDPLDHLGMTANGDGSVTLFDVLSLEKRAKLPVQSETGFAYFDWNTNRLLAMGEQTAVIRPGDGKTIGSIALLGRPLAATDNLLGTIYVVISGRPSLAVINTSQLALKREMPVPGCRNPRTVAIDANHKHLFVGCDNHVLVVLDEDSGKRIKSLSLCAGVYTTVFDPGEDLIVNSCADGRVSFIQEISGMGFGSAGSVKTKEGSLGMAFDQRNQRIFVLGKENSSEATSERDPSSEGKQRSTQVVYLIGRPLQ